GFEAPADDLEAAIAAAWEAHLGLRPIGRHEGFLALGGHSLLALGVAARLEATLGRPVPLAPLLAGQTVADLARSLRGEAPATGTDPLLVPLRVGGDRPPLILIHAVGGTAGPFLPLAAGLAPGRPVWGLQAPALAGEPMPPDLAGLADRYARAIGSLALDGDYVLGGWSLGGVLAFETARRLPHPPCRVIMLDAALPAQAPTDEATLRALFAFDLQAAFGAAAPTDVEPLYAVFAALVAAANGYHATPADLDLVSIGALEGLLAGDPAGPWLGLVPPGRLYAAALPGDHHGLLRSPDLARLVEGFLPPG
ncbi:MAG: Malonyl CoA-acyl carrier protein transacylase, partial [Cyanobacteria bacterium RYN_339]|nr:Malonyl CoA-acyl carrier protein transacylase [Cyanobacteria bacterium RYN_339]